MKRGRLTFDKIAEFPRLWHVPRATYGFSSTDKIAFVALQDMFYYCAANRQEV